MLTTTRALAAVLLAGAASTAYAQASTPTPGLSLGGQSIGSNSVVAPGPQSPQALGFSASSLIDHETATLDLDRAAEIQISVGDVEFVTSFRVVDVSDEPGAVDSSSLPGAFSVVPEPSAAALLLGAAGLAMLRRRSQA